MPDFVHCGEGASGAAVAVFKAFDVAFVEVAEGDLEESSAFWTARDAMFASARAEKNTAFACIVVRIVDTDDAGALDDAPKFVPALMGLQADGLTGIHGDYLHGGLFVQREALEKTPWPYSLLIIREVFQDTPFQNLKELSSLGQSVRCFKKIESMRKLG